jgi:hypothetical protein
MKCISLVLLVFFISSCNSNRANNKEVSMLEPTSTTSVIEAGIDIGEVGSHKEWDFIINPPGVGSISTEYQISEIATLLPPNYTIMKDSVLSGTDEILIVLYVVRKSNKTIFEIYPQINNNETISNEIYSIVVLHPEYVIADTELRVGSTLGELKKVFPLKDIYSDVSSGLFIYCNEFNGAFSIDLEGEDYWALEELSLEELPDRLKIKTIIIY